MQKVKSGVYSFTEQVVTKDDIPKSTIDGERLKDLKGISSRLTDSPDTVIRRDFDLSSQAGSYISSLNTIIRRTGLNTMRTCRRGKNVFIFQK